jgi:asparagine N-glycosylation enzyme membrane subunit Stt3
MPPPQTPSNSLVLSYLDLRKAIGIIGIALPFVLALGKIILESPGIQSSISSYYYTVMRDVFVGSLCAIAVFLMSYRGYERKDDIAGRLACLFALGTALFPTAPDANATGRDTIIGTAHLLFAAFFFLTLAFFALVLFRKTNPDKPPTRRKKQRNMVYTVCGYAIIACIALIVLVKFLPDGSPVQKFAPVFWLEAAAIVAFGVSWFVKGEAILKDDEVEVLPNAGVSPAPQ